MCPVAPGDGRRVSMPRDACWEQRAEPCLNDTSPPSWFEWYFTYVFLGVLLYNTYEIARRHSVCISSPEWATLLSHRFLFLYCVFWGSLRILWPLMSQIRSPL
jgi:hypothetical protein